MYLLYLANVTSNSVWLRLNISMFLNTKDRRNGKTTNVKINFGIGHSGLNIYKNITMVCQPSLSEIGHSGLCLLNKIAQKKHISLYRLIISSQNVSLIN